MCARTSDGGLIGETVHSHGDTSAIEPKSTELYQLGYNRSIELHDVQLKHVLQRRVEMVEEGKWEVEP